jgi:intein-encoded DNA endonuclease-like protein
MAISGKWKEPEKQYREWYQSKQNFALGEVQFVRVKKDMWVGNIIGQRDIKADKEGNPPIRYDAINTALAKACSFAIELKASVLCQG